MLFILPGFRGARGEGRRQRKSSLVFVGKRSAATKMFKPPEHQVAGHQASLGQLGPLVDGSGRFFKPLQSAGRGDDELAFYSSFASHPAVPDAILRFFPAFHGTVLLPAFDGSGDRSHIILEDLLAGIRFPSVIDLKIGARTWPTNASEDYISKCLDKDRETSSVALGFRISGLQIHQTGVGGADGGEVEFWRPSRAEVKTYTTKTTVDRALRQFISTNKATDPDPDSMLAAAVYGGADGVISQLRELKAWFEEQTLFQFYSASLLVAYEKDAAIRDGLASAPRVKLVDFAHVANGDGVIDHNFLGGLCSLIKFLSEILNTINDDVQDLGKIESWT